MLILGLRFLDNQRLVDGTNEIMKAEIPFLFNEISISIEQTSSTQWTSSSSICSSSFFLSSSSSSSTYAFVGSRLSFLITVGFMRLSNRYFCRFLIILPLFFEKTKLNHLYFSNHMQCILHFILYFGYSGHGDVLERAPSGRWKGK